MLLPLIATGLSLGQGLTTLFGDEVLVAFGRDAPIGDFCIGRVREQHMLGLLFDGTRRSIGFFTVLTPVTCTDLALAVIRQASIWASPSLAQGGTTARR